VLGALKPDVAPVAVEGLRNRVLPSGVLGAVEAATREQGGERRDADPVDLPRQDVVDALLQVRELLRETLGKPPRDLPEEHPGLSDGIEERNRRVRPDARAVVVFGPGLL